MENATIRINPYLNALKDFVRKSIQHPEIFHISTDDQHMLARQTLEKHKMICINEKKEVEGII